MEGTEGTAVDRALVAVGKGSTAWALENPQDREADTALFGQALSLVATFGKEKTLLAFAYFCRAPSMLGLGRVFTSREIRTLQCLFVQDDDDDETASVASSSDESDDPEDDEDEDVDM
jgi:hypothetical protein